MKFRQLHRWDLSAKEAVALQRRLAGRVDASRKLGHFDLVAAADLSHTRFSKRCYAGVVVCSLQRGLGVIEQAWAQMDVAFPYVPGLLSFRETPALLRAFEKLSCRPEVVIVDGHGRAHPRRFGLACHVGLLLGVPTLGCAKSRLVGTYQEPGPHSGNQSPLVDDGEVIGAVLRTRDRVKSVYVSVGHRIDLHGAVSVVLSCRTRYRLPEPIRLAHQYVNALRRGQ